MEKYTNRTFAKALGDLLSDKYGDTMGRYTLTEFLDEMRDKTGFSQEYIRLMLREKRPLVLPRTVEAAAEIVGVDPFYFMEYRQWWTISQLKRHPQLMGQAFDIARAFVEALDDEGERRHPPTCQLQRYSSTMVGREEAE